MSYKRKTRNCIQRAIVLFYVHSPSEVLRYNVDRGEGESLRRQLCKCLLSFKTIFKGASVSAL